MYIGKGVENVANEEGVELEEIQQEKRVEGKRRGNFQIVLQEKFS